MEHNNISINVNQESNNPLAKPASNQNPTAMHKNNFDKQNINIFVSYSSRDRVLRSLLVEGLRGHLAQNKDFRYQTWDDREIDLGANWKETIEAALEKSNAALLLVSANFAGSSFINREELTAFFRKQRENGYLILPVLVREYKFSEFGALSKPNFFKTYNSDYGFNKPAERHKLMPFDRLAEGNDTSDRLLNIYYGNLAEFIHTAIKNHFGK